jgi:hypothetical protein
MPEVRRFPPPWSVKEQAACFELLLLFHGLVGLHVCSAPGQTSLLASGAPCLTSLVASGGSAGNAGINHWSASRCEWAGAIRHDRHVRNRIRSGWRVVKAEGPHRQAELGCQFLDRPGTPTRQHRVQTNLASPPQRQDTPYSRWRRKSSTLCGRT